MSTKPRYSLPPPVVGRKQQEQRQRQRQQLRRANDVNSQAEQTAVKESTASSYASTVSSDSNIVPATGSPESGGNSHEESVTVHNENAFALLVGDDDDDNSFADDPTFEQEIDAAEGEVIVSSETIKIQNAELLQLMFENYTPPSPTSGLRGKKAGGRNGPGRDDGEKGRPRSKEDKKAKRKKHKQRPSSRETSNSSGDRRRRGGGRPSSREQPSAMIPIAGRREGREHAERHHVEHVEHVGQDYGAPLPSGPATSMVRLSNAASHGLYVCCNRCNGMLQDCLLPHTYPLFATLAGANVIRLLWKPCFLCLRCCVGCCDVGFCFHA